MPSWARRFPHRSPQSGSLARNDNSVDRSEAVLAAHGRSVKIAVGSQNHTAIRIGPVYPAGKVVQYGQGAGRIQLKHGPLIVQAACAGSAVEVALCVAHQPGIWVRAIRTRKCMEHSLVAGRDVHHENYAGAAARKLIAAVKSHAIKIARPIAGEGTGRISIGAAGEAVEQSHLAAARVQLEHGSSTGAAIDGGSV